MNTYRIIAIIRRHLLVMFRKPLQFFELAYWPVFDLVLWGLTSSWIKTIPTNNNAMITSMIAAIVVWQIAIRSCMDIATSLMEEMWVKNIINLCVTPLKVYEWVVAVMTLGLFKLPVPFFLTMSGAWLLFDCNLLQLGWPFLLFGSLAILAGWWSGLLAASVAIYFGPQFAVLIWVIAWLNAALGAVFCPLSYYPTWAYYMAKISPVTPIFESLRLYISTGIINYHALSMSFIFNLICIGIAYLIFIFMLEKSRNKGLARLGE